MTTNDEDVELWEYFQVKVEELFVTGYSLSTTFHPLAIEDIEGRLSVWKGKIAPEEQNQSPMSHSDVYQDAGINTACTITVIEPCTIQDGTIQDGTHYESLKESMGPGMEILKESMGPGMEILKESMGPGMEMNCPHQSPDTEATIKTESSEEKTRTKQGFHLKRSHSKLKQTLPQQEVAKTRPKRRTAKTSGRNDAALYPRKCPHCPKIYSTVSGYMHHLKNHCIPCPDCSFEATSKHELFVHRNDAHPETTNSNLICRQCKLGFSSEADRNIHASSLSHYPIPCTFCPKEFSSLPGYKIHRRLHTGEGLKCPECDYVGGNRTAIRLHVKKLHLGIRDFLCDLCAKSFLSRGSLNQHRIAAHFRDQYKDRYRCEECPFTTHSRDSMKNHTMTHHRERPGYMCHICGAKLISKASLESHQQRHNIQKTFQCSWENCTFKAICRGDLRKHVRRKHEIQPHEECQICKKCFKNKSHLRRHVVVHTGQKDFKCDLCNYQCNVKANLSKHIVNVHKETPPRERQPIQKFSSHSLQGLSDNKTVDDKTQAVETGLSTVVSRSHTLTDLQNAQVAPVSVGTGDFRVESHIYDTMCW